MKRTRNTFNLYMVFRNTHTHTHTHTLTEDFTIDPASSSSLPSRHHQRSPVSLWTGHPTPSSHLCLITLHLPLTLALPMATPRPCHYLELFYKRNMTWASLVAQWLRICLLMQGTRVRALAWEDPTCRRAAGPVSHNC